MLKLIIADDERMIRESISSLIDWNSLGIDLIGTCGDGIEAYNMILDESPDIVLTDIRMPGISGLELVERISQTDMDIQFIILSGFGEFEYAKQAMKYRVHHYLLKPSNEAQIIDSMKDVIQEYYHRRAFQDLQNRQKALTENLHHSILENMITEQLFLDGSPHPSWDSYSGFMDFFNTGYELCYLHYVEEEALTSVLRRIKDYLRNSAPGISLYSLYVKNTLILFFESHQVSYDNLDAFINKLSSTETKTAYEYRRNTCQNLAKLIEILIGKIKRYGIIYFMNGLHPVPICNYKNLMTKIKQLTSKIMEPAKEERTHIIEELKHTLDGISNPEFLKQAGSRMVIQFTTGNHYGTSVEGTEYLLKLNEQTEAPSIRGMLMEAIEKVSENTGENGKTYSPFIEKVMQYVGSNLNNPNLTLKWIAENYLFMNVDYVSARFVKETKQKFSIYLTTQRIQKAKKLMEEGHTESIQWIAEKIGCGNNPQYFSQIFKKNTKMTPSAYIKMINGGD
ncbi:response regulator [Clostridium sp. E02]|uniref:response regulator transcription factor n=1 Tax=Clostridium sp. E02 TaxID=2487134 RepID=UPI000F524A77|nr:response regulator [Clostridium sp. E02]